MNYEDEKRLASQALDSFLRGQKHITQEDKDSVSSLLDQMGFHRNIVRETVDLLNHRMRREHG